ncbi:DUF222 domain-containing protein [Phytoactinopolyspora alkaliphila]|uniref:DUF222 domain-containing protein n=1 Tax=Phytoactinopolyspora alkaliphila TaxID=1783498 RepID=A0A6N9YJC0_9ACTN|nr:HNH endonuclease signature motif containing protein [Phytoactinopolyspora alkaliphila]NED95083.1 DUF222 domain-containing protein [Phytoactinopolyspora alkaliphila]
MSSSVVTDLLVATKEVAAADSTALSDDELTSELTALRRAADMAEAAYLQRLRDFHTRKISETTAALSTRAWIRHELHIAPAETSRQLKVARGLRSLPAIEAALKRGEIRFPHAGAIVDAATLLGNDVIAGCQDALLNAARADEPTKLRAALRGLGAAVDNKDAVRRAEKRDQGRWLDVSTTMDDTLAISGSLGSEDGAIVETAINSLTTPAGADDSRTASQRRADALVELCRRQLSSGELPSQGGEPTQVIVVTDLATLEARSGGFGELPNGTILRGDTVRRLACDAKVTRLIVGPDSLPLDVGRAQRTATPAQRKALRLRDGGCLFPGCDLPPEWTDVHHATFWAHGGRTDIDQMLLLCRKHHTTVHKTGWHIQTLGPGRFQFIDPHGVLHPAHRRHSTTDTVNQLLESTRESPPRAGPRASSRGASAQGSSIQRPTTGGEVNSTERDDAA